MHKEDSGPENGELLLLLLARMLTTYFNAYYVIHKTSFTSNIVDVVFFFFFPSEFSRGSFQFHLPDTLLTLQRLSQLKCSTWKGFEKKMSLSWGKYVLKNTMWMPSAFSATTQWSQLCALRLSNPVSTLFHTLTKHGQRDKGHLSFFLLLSIFHLVAMYLQISEIPGINFINILKHLE